MRLAMDDKICGHFRLQVLAHASCQIVVAFEYPTSNPAFLIQFLELFQTPSFQALKSMRDQRFRWVLGCKTSGHVLRWYT